MAINSDYEESDTTVTARTEVCSLRRCACALLLVLIGLACLIGAGVGLYLHLSDEAEPELILLDTPPVGHPVRISCQTLTTPDQYTTTPHACRVTPHA